MSYKVYINYGYGVCTDDLEPHVNKETFTKLVSLAPNYKESIKNFLESLEDVSSFEDNDLYPDICDFEYSIAEVLAQVIKETENIEFTACSNFDDYHYLIFQPVYPWSQVSETEKKLTMDKIEEVIYKYTSIFVKDKLVADYQEVENGG